MNSEKQTMRTILRARRDSLPEAYFQAAGQKITSRILSSPEYRNADVIMAFVGTQGEGSTDELLRRILRDGRSLVLPVCLSGGILSPRLVRDTDALVAGKYGIPCPGPSCPVCPIERIDLLLVPCVSCTRDGRRIGHGAGYYDRFIASYLAQRPDGVIRGLCPEKMISTSLPTDSRDRPLPAIITEENTYFAAT